MAALKSNLSTVRIGRLRFLNEQQGPFENQLKERLCLLFDRVSGVYKAYLLRVNYEGSVDHGVVLGIRADENKMASISVQIGEVFASLFSTEECLDIVLLDRDMEINAEIVCRPFYLKIRRNPDEF